MSTSCQKLGNVYEMDKVLPNHLKRNRKHESSREIEFVT
jgi:hypothetical protein